MRKLFIAAGMLIALTLGATPALGSQPSHRPAHLTTSKHVSSKHAKKHSTNKHHKHSKSKKHAGK
jgi:hypothetical protein